MISAIASTRSTVSIFGGYPDGYAGSDVCTDKQNGYVGECRDGVGSSMMTMMMMMAVVGNFGQLSGGVHEIGMVRDSSESASVGLT